MYILLRQNTVQEIIPDEDPVFPGVPISERYPADFAAALLHVPDGTEVEQNWGYDPESGTFFPQAPETGTPPDEESDAAFPAELEQRVIALERAIERGFSL